MGEKVPVELKIKDGVPGISKDQISGHYDILYKGYCTKINEIATKLKTADTDGANATYHPFRELKREEVFTTNATRLHEGYFDSLGGDGEVNGKIKEWIEEDFGSFESWKNDFTALGMSARGWAILAYDFTDGQLHSYLSDIHSDGVWSAVPLLVLDVYEHAYFTDYGTGRKNYLEAYFKNIDWDEVNQKIERYGLHKVRYAG